MIGNGVNEQRVLILAPTSKDGSLTSGILERASIRSHTCRCLDEVCTELTAGAAALLVAEEQAVGADSDQLATWLARQPPWSDLPVLLLARQGADSPALARSIERLGNVVVLERPTRVAALVSATRTALSARRRQYQIREHLAARERDEEALRAGDRRKDEFLAILAHELRNPLAPILNALNILQLSSPSDPIITRVGEMMERQLGHLVRLVDDLMEVSRISQGRIELRKETIDLADVVRTAVEACRPLIDASCHRLRTVIPDQPMMLTADPVRLAQVLENLLNNAAKYTAPGGQIELQVHSEDEMVLIAVRDTGSGIADDMLPRVFDLFTRVEQGAHRAQGGLGIGLTLVKSLVEMHGGSVEAKSGGADKGSEFIVRLPLTSVEPPSKLQEVALPQSAPAPRSARVLVVDDNRDAADSLGLLLRSLGCDVKVVYSGAAALEYLHSYHPSAVLLDIGMPEMDGHEVARRIRKDPEFHDLTLIALSGWGQKHDLERSRAAGFDHHLIKPADMNALQSLLLAS